MSKRNEEIQLVVAELDIRVAQVEASLAILKALVAEGDGEGSPAED